MQDFICVPVSNLDQDTVHIKKIDEEMKSKNFNIHDTDTENPLHGGGY